MTLSSATSAGVSLHTTPPLPPIGDPALPGVANPTRPPVMDPPLGPVDPEDPGQPIPSPTPPHTPIAPPGIPQPPIITLSALGRTRHSSS